jgi:hypothetical protein
MYKRPLGNHYMMYAIEKWRWYYITFPIKMVNIIVYQNHRLKDIDSVENVDGHGNPPESGASEEVHTFRGGCWL